MIFVKNSLVLVGLALASSVQATPGLKMHVFEQPEAEVTSSTAISSDWTEPTNSDDASIKLHVFDRSQRLQDNAVIPEYKKRRPVKKKDSFLSYERIELYAKTGYRRGELNFTIPGQNGVPNILSELHWEDLEIATFNLGSSLYLNSNWFINADVVFGHIFDGDVQDSDYNGNNRTLEFSRSNNGADEGNILDISLSVGYVWQVPKSEARYPLIELRPQLGVSYYSQNLKMVDGNQTVSAFGYGVPLGPISGLDTNYDTTWTGPWLGIDSSFMFSKVFSLKMGLEYHYAFYNATADWNLRSDLAHPESFTQEAKGYGWVVNIEGEVTLTSNLSLNVGVEYQDWQADRDGSRKHFLSSGDVLKLGYNGVTWESIGANIGINYRF